MISKTLDQYQLVEVIGQSGPSTVYKAYQPSLEQWVAVKVIDANSPTMFVNFAQQAVTELHHRNIAIVHGYGETDDCRYVAMEYVAEGTLKNLLAEQPMEWIEAVSLAITLGEALDYAHKTGIVHSDIKPSNILMPEKDWPLLADFGQMMPHHLKDGQVVMGTPAYISPEQANGKSATIQSDIYSLGILLFEMVTGHLPFLYLSPDSLVKAHLSETPPLPSKLNPVCPEDLDNVILTALQKDPADRFPTMEAMVAALRKAAGGSTLSMSASLRPIIETEAFRPASSKAIGPIKQESIMDQEAELLLPDQNVTVAVPSPAPGSEGIIIGRKYRRSGVGVDLGAYGAKDAGMSRQHARLTRQGPNWFIEDMDSTNGTYVNQIKLEPGVQTPLRNGAVVRCSHLSFIFLIPNL
ncbi:MAG: protein kinase [Chloroflexota bacterium]